MIATFEAARAAVNAATSSGVSSQDADTVINNWLDLLDKMRARHVAVIPDHDRLDVHEHGGQPNNLLSEFIQYIDNRYQLLLLGAELTTGSGSGAGAYALGAVHKSATNSMVSYHRGGIDEEITRDLIRDVYLRNIGNFRKLGIDWPGAGGVKFSSVVESEEKKEELMDSMMTTGPKKKDFKELLG